MKKKISVAVSGLACILAFSACSEDESPRLPQPVYGKESVVVLNQGSYYSGIESTADVLDLVTGLYGKDVFAAVNGQSLGADVQAGLRYGDCIYVAMYGSDLIWKLDAATLRVRGSAEVRQPEDLAASDGFVFVTGNDGIVSRVDTLTLRVDVTGGIGPNPSGIVAAGGSIYAAVSDGYNSRGQYENGFRVVKINPRSLRVESEIRVGMNPTGMTVAASGDVFVACQGNYGDVRPEIYRFRAGEDRAEPFCPGSRTAAHGNLLYVIYDYTDYYYEMTYERELSYKTYDITTGSLISEAFIPADAQPENPYSIDINPSNGDIYIGSYAGTWDFVSPGWLYRYAAAGGSLLGRYATSAPGTCAVVFN